MHDIVFAKVILNNLDIVRDKSKEIKEVHLEVGELSGIEPDHLIEHLNEQSKIIFKAVTKKSLIRCPCGYEGPAEIVEVLHDRVIWKCPWCDDPIETMEVIEGDKIKILKIIYH